MRKSILTVPEIGLIGITRVALGAGLALLLGEKLNRDERRAAGWSLFLIGALNDCSFSAECFGKEAARERTQLN